MPRGWRGLPMPPKRPGCRRCSSMATASISPISPGRPASTRASRRRCSSSCRAGGRCCSPGRRTRAPAGPRRSASMSASIRPSACSARSARQTPPLADLLAEAGIARGRCASALPAGNITGRTRRRIPTGGSKARLSSSIRCAGWSARAGRWSMRRRCSCTPAPACAPSTRSTSSPPSSSPRSMSPKRSSASCSG